MGSTKAVAPSSPHFLQPLITIDASVSLFLHKLFKPILPAFLFLLLEYSADFQFTFPVSIALFLASPSFSSLAVPLILGHLLDCTLIGRIKLISPVPVLITTQTPSVHTAKSFPSGHASRALF
ncbi:Phosphatidic acid phosphatase (PAP2) family protein [Hibiscus syriacus]|uniref:Phosphatidic acid phosphatase (PAP2) family protein n=1 Tax=Hibiscus syriacus TaxID=106335 RepID=A0A6A2YB04_HIBSY|nr:Phosphatidic acid phosphatase (PAP2) family protein [Hibiscus syriacus]